MIDKLLVTNKNKWSEKHGLYYWSYNLNGFNRHGNHFTVERIVKNKNLTYEKHFKRNARRPFSYEGILIYTKIKDD